METKTGTITETQREVFVPVSSISCWEVERMIENGWRVTKLESLGSGKVAVTLLKGEQSR